MSWEAIDAVSSLVSAVGVIATLIYLAYQIRQNTQSIQGATEQSLVYSAYVQYNRKLIPLEAWEAYERSTADYFRGPGYLAAWHSLKTSYPEEFCKAMDKVERDAARE